MSSAVVRRDAAVSSKDLRSGRLRRNFQGYTTDQADALIGLGASAIGRLAQGFVQNAPDVAGYAHAVSSGSLATVREIALSRPDLQNRKVPLLLRHRRVRVGGPRLRGLLIFA